jgi:hypothetical protein
MSDYEHEPINEAIEWAILRTVSTEVEARLMAGRLQSEGIPAFVLSQVDSTRNFTVGSLAVAKVFVPATMFDLADTVLRTPPPPFEDFPIDDTE